MSIHGTDAPQTHDGPNSLAQIVDTAQASSSSLKLRGSSVTTNAKASRSNANPAVGAIATGMSHQSPSLNQPASMSGQLVKSACCTACRSFKTRCWPNPVEPDGPCLRCQKMEVHCDRTARKRGRKRKYPPRDDSTGADLENVNRKAPGQSKIHTPLQRKLMARSDASINESKSNESYSLVEQSMFDGSIDVGSSQIPSPTLAMLDFGNKHEQEQPIESMPELPEFSLSELFHDGSSIMSKKLDAARQSSIGFSESSDLSDLLSVVQDASSAPTTSIFQGFADRGHSIAEGLELVSTVAGHQPRTSTSHTGDSALYSFEDPINTGVISIMQADNLVSYYFQHLQDCICLLDPQLHTRGYMRQHARVLFLSVLAIAAKFSATSALYQQLLSKAKDAIKRAMFQPLYDIEIIQAICILVYWKNATDDSGWLWIGHACRLGFKLGLHQIDTALPLQDPPAARQAMDKQRTWITLYCTDNHHSETHSLPPSIQPIHLPNIDVWLASNLEYHLPCDGQLAYVVGVLQAKSTFASISSSLANVVLLKSVLASAACNIRSHNALWTGEDPPIRLAPLSKAIIRFYSQCREVIIEETSMRVANPQDLEVQLGLYISALLVLLDIVIIDFVNTGYINTMQDLIVVAIASSTLRLIRCLANAQPEIRSIIVSKLSQVTSACHVPASADPASAAAYLNRFIARLLGRMTKSCGTGAPSPLRSTSPPLSMSAPSAQDQGNPCPFKFDALSGADSTGHGLDLSNLNDMLSARPGLFDFEFEDSTFWSLAAPHMLDNVDTLLGGGPLDLPAPIPSVGFDVPFAAQYPWPEFLSFEPM